MQSDLCLSLQVSDVFTKIKPAFLSACKYLVVSWAFSFLLGDAEHVLPSLSVHLFCSIFAVQVAEVGAVHRCCSEDRKHNTAAEHWGQAFSMDLTVQQNTFLEKNGNSIKISSCFET